MKKGKKFDIVIGSAFGSETGYYLALKFNSSMVLFGSYSSSIPWLDNAIGQPHIPSFMPTLNFEYGSDMNFYQRLKNLFATTILQYMRHNFVATRIESVLDKHFPGEDRISVLDLERNVAMAFGYTHPLFHDGWRPTNPNYVHLGMMNCR